MPWSRYLMGGISGDIKSSRQRIRISQHFLSECGGVVQLNSFLRRGRISNPVFPGVYPSSNFSCFWTIRNSLSRRGIHLKLSVTSRATPSFNGSSPCRNFTLLAENPAARQSVLLCGPGVYLRSVSAGSSVTIEFRSHRSQTLPPFEIIYQGKKFARELIADLSNQ